MTRFLRTSIWVAGFLLASTTAKADSVPTVAYTVSGSSGDWTLDFTVTDNTDQNLYFFGVLLPTDDQTGTPTGWQLFGSDWNNSSEGGSSTEYNNVWINSDAGIGNVTPGNSLGGFDAVVTTATAPTSVEYFAYTCDASFLPQAPECGGSAYTGAGNFHGVDNPGFEGIARNGSAVPEPRWAGILAIAVVGLVVRRRTRKSELVAL